MTKQKNSKTLKIVIFAILCFFVILYILLNKSGSDDKNISQDEKNIFDTIKIQEIKNSSTILTQEMIDDIPTALEGYKRLEINSGDECNSIENEKDSPYSDISGEMCISKISLTYAQEKGNEILFIDLIKVNDGVDLNKKLIEKAGKFDTLGSYNIFRVEEITIGWIPVSDFDVIFVQEGKYKIDSSNNVEYNYDEIPSGENPIIQYFINKYPPNTV